ncbi:MAG: hypothetical protein WDN72_06480 [Alphaproteobacteria bacterium]
MLNINNLTSEFEHSAIKSHSVDLPIFNFDKTKLNIEMRSRKSRLPWRGQFSPELIEYFMDVVCSDSRSFLDPFCGSGTVLYEAAIRGCTAWGIEVNPAAWHLASLTAFANLSTPEKNTVLEHVQSLAMLNNSTSSIDLFSSSFDPQTILETIGAQSTGAFLARTLAAVILLGMGNEKELTRASVVRGAMAVLAVFNELKNIDGSTDCYIGDARKIPFSDETIEAVITSPPYINVFNYHQNYRPATELLGWNPLEAARTEIGSNRKHRMNRFLTVIQYCLDMAQCIDEMTRVMVTGAPLVIVLGRTSNVLGASFQNGNFIRELLNLSGGFGAIQSAERVFTNRFGERIYEDILIAHRKKRGYTDLNDARGIGVSGLILAKGMVSEKNLNALESAIESAGAVCPSPALNISTPDAFRNVKEKEYASS